MLVILAWHALFKISGANATTFAAESSSIHGTIAKKIKLKKILVGFGKPILLNAPFNPACIISLSLPTLRVNYETYDNK